MILSFAQTRESKLKSCAFPITYLSLYAIRESVNIQECKGTCLVGRGDNSKQIHRSKLLESVAVIHIHLMYILLLLLWRLFLMINVAEGSITKKKEITYAWGPQFMYFTVTKPWKKQRISFTHLKKLHRAKWWQKYLIKNFNVMSV